MTVGKPLGNGYPIAAVVTTNKIASTLGDYINTVTEFGLRVKFIVLS